MTKGPKFSTRRPRKSKAPGPRIREESPIVRSKPSYSDYRSFDALINLAKKANAKNDRVREEEVWRRIEGHAFSEWLFNKTSLSNALALVERNRFRTRGWRRPPDWKARLTDLFAFHTFVYAERKAKGISFAWAPDSKSRRATGRVTKRLISLMDSKRVRLQSSSHNSILRDLLADLLDQMSPLPKVRLRADPTRDERTVLLEFTVSLIEEFGAAPSMLVQQFTSPLYAKGFKDAEGVIKKARAEIAFRDLYQTYRHRRDESPFLGRENSPQKKR